MDTDKEFVQLYEKLRNNEDLEAVEHFVYLMNKHLTAMEVIMDKYALDGVEHSGVLKCKKEFLVRRTRLMNMVGLQESLRSNR